MPSGTLVASAWSVLTVGAGPVGVGLLVVADPPEELLLEQPATSAVAIIVVEARAASFFVFEWAMVINSKYLRLPCRQV